MSESPVQQRKICRVCGTECSGKPRVKDRDGRYVCKVCADKARDADGATSPGPPASDGELLRQLLHDSAAAKAAAMTTCESCGAEIRKGAVVCTACGYDQRSGKRIKPKIEVLKLAKKARERKTKP